MSEKSYADLVALSQFLPGPASSQVGIGVGVMRGGVLGGLTSFIGFTLPSVIVLMIFASLMTTFDISEAGWIHGLKIVAVVIVLHAIMGMSKNLTPDIERKVIALFALVATLLFQSVFTQVGVILIAAVIGFILFKDYKTMVKNLHLSQLRKVFLQPAWYYFSYCYLRCRPSVS
jgi:Chromate transport protein ChrA